MLCVWRERINGKWEGCANHRWRNWYLCWAHIMEVRTRQHAQAEMEAQKRELPAPKPSGGGGITLSYWGLAAGAR